LSKDMIGITEEEVGVSETDEVEVEETDEQDPE